LELAATLHVFVQRDTGKALLEVEPIPGLASASV